MCRHFIYERELRSCWHERKHIFCCIPFGEENKKPTNKKHAAKYLFLSLYYILFYTYIFLQCNIYLMSGYLYFCIHLFPFFCFLHVYNLLFDWLFSLFHFCRESSNTKKWQLNVCFCT